MSKAFMKCELCGEADEKVQFFNGKFKANYHKNCFEEMTCYLAMINWFKEHPSYSNEKYPILHRSSTPTDLYRFDLSQNRIKLPK